MEELIYDDLYKIKDSDIVTVLEKRNKNWKKNKEIPIWVAPETVDLDQFFTKNEVAKNYVDFMFNYLKKKGINNEDCVFIEPSAGDGSFLQYLPKQQRIGLDIFPLRNDIIETDFLNWSLEKRHKNKKIIFVGNPPFGYRSWLALLFMNHAAKFADYVFFILPMAFQSDGKGSPKGRVNGLKLIHSETVPKESFYKTNNAVVKVNALFQVWEKGTQIMPKYDKAKKYLDLFTVDDRPERLCGQEKKNDADFFIQRTYYSNSPNIVYNFKDVKYGCGYGVIIKNELLKDDIIKIFENIDWDNYSNLAAHNCRHVSIYHIQKAFLEKFN